MLRTVERPAMGSRAVVSADLDARCIAAAHGLIAAAERRWSRFLGDSVVSIVRAATSPVMVDEATAVILDFAAHGAALTDHWFDPGLRHTGVCLHRQFVAESPLLDLGGVAKGWTADLVADRLVADGATVALADIGGDVRVRSQRTVLVECEAPDQRSQSAIFAVRDAGIAMSGPTRQASHLIDPSSGRPAQARVALVVARSAAAAEVLATAAAVAPLGEAIAFLERVGAAAWLIESNGLVSVTGQPDRFLIEAGWLAAESTRSWREARCPVS
ncbi:MAG: FAD:protein FMN transferase [Acidimicrobiaceae bacterium]|nr:FAD:protein FMN transferase [Acidimicrobiaceae bacterium]